MVRQMWIAVVAATFGCGAKGSNATVPIEGACHQVVFEQGVGIDGGSTELSDWSCASAFADASLTFPICPTNVESGGGCPDSFKADTSNSSAAITQTAGTMGSPYTYVTATCFNCESDGFGTQWTCTAQSLTTNAFHWQATASFTCAR
jgi:hypothetical protein